MPLGLPIRDKRVPRWRRSRHDLRVEVHLTLAGRWQERALHVSSSSSSFSSQSTAQHSVDDISPTHSGTIFFLGGWFHSIGFDIYFSQLGVALHFVTIFQVKKKSDFVAARLAKSAEAWKRKEEIEAL